MLQAQWGLPAEYQTPSLSQAETLEVPTCSHKYLCLFMTSAIVLESVSQF